MSDVDSFSKIDAHIHYNADRKNLLSVAEEFNFDLLTINTEIPDFPSIENQRKLALKHDAKSEIDLNHVTTVSSEKILSDDWANYAISKIKNDLQAGAIGVKFWKNIGMSIQRPDGSFLMPNDPELEPVFTYLEKNQIPVLGHQGEPKNCWLPVEDMTVKGDQNYFSQHPEYHMYKHKEYPNYWDHIQARDSILDRHPDLHFIGLHLASLEWNLDEVGKRLNKYPNLAVDLAERINHLYYHTAKNRKKVIDFFETYQDRIIYGTDIINAPEESAEAINNELKNRWNKHWKFLASNEKLNSEQIESSFSGLNLTRNILEKIYRENAEAWYQL